MFNIRKKIATNITARKSFFFNSKRWEYRRVDELLFWVKTSQVTISVLYSTSPPSIHLMILLKDNKKPNKHVFDLIRNQRLLLSRLTRRFDFDEMKPGKKFRISIADKIKYFPSVVMHSKKGSTIFSSLTAFCHRCDFAVHWIDARSLIAKFIFLMSSFSCVWSADK